ncbi:MAG: DNA repair protein RecO [Candidatus Edwardsbacteria bacterium]|nr:DNA repair protein RecO [Candidatus Edwardsbacteria bacterium]
MILRDEAIVLKGQNWSETSRIVHAFALHGGRIKLVARGARRPKSRFGAALEPGTLAQVVYYASRNSDLHTASEAAVLWRPLCADLDAFRLAPVALELAYKAAPAETPNVALFRNLLAFLQSVDAGPDDSRFTRLAAFYLLALNNLGYDPVLDRCLCCRRPAAGGPLWFSAARGGLVCAECRRRVPETVPLDDGQSRALRMWQAHRALPELDPGEAKRLLEVLAAFLNHHIAGRSRMVCTAYL